jgi:hypothetical protein
VRSEETHPIHNWCDARHSRLPIRMRSWRRGRGVCTCQVMRPTSQRKQAGQHEAATRLASVIWEKTLTLRPFRDKRVLVATLATVLAATLLLATAVLGRGSRLDRPPEATDASAQAPRSPNTGSTPGASPGSTPNTSPSSTSNAPTTRRQGPITRIIQWMNEQAPLGGGAESTQEEAFLAMLEGNCAGALKLSERRSAGLDRIPEPSRTLYEAAASACLAGFERRPELWPRAEAAFDKIRTRTSRLDCQEQTVYRVLTSLIHLHRTEPNTQLVRRAGGGRGVLKCPRFTSITPDHGPPEGGYPIRLEGENLPRVVGVNFGPEHHLTSVSEDGRHVVIIAPPDRSSYGGAFVWPDGWPFDYAYSPEFIYDASDPGKQPSTTTSEPPTTTTKPPTTLPPRTGPPPSSS